MAMNLSADDLRDLKEPHARLEEHRGDQWVFSIDGMLRGKHVRGALFEGESMIVQAPTQRDAQTLADAGLRHTIHLAQEAKSPFAAGMTLEVPEERPLKPGEAEARERNRRMVIDALEGKE